MTRLVPFLLPWCAALVFACTGCSDPLAEDGMREVAGELRALRVELQAKPAAAAVAALDRDALAAAMAPLREVLTGLVRDMADMQTREAALANEFQRWSQLLAQSVTDGRKEEATALQQRIQKLEGELQAQATRQRESEALMARALDATSARIETLLDALQPGAGKVTPKDGGTGTSPAPGTASTNPNGNGGSAPAATGNGAETAVPWTAALRNGRRSASPWWYALGIGGLLAGGFFAFWLRRENAVARPPMEAATDDGARELWAAAALLGEAVGRLRQQGSDAAGDAMATAPSSAAPAILQRESPARPDAPTDPASPAPESLPAPDAPSEDDEFVIEDAVDGAAPAATPPKVSAITASAMVPGSPGAGGPCPSELERLLPSRDPIRSAGAVLAIALRDPRVLRRPGPVVEPLAHAVRLRCAVLPMLSPGQLAHLELLLREAAR